MDIHSFVGAVSQEIAAGSVPGPLQFAFQWRLTFGDVGSAAIDDVRVRCLDAAGDPDSYEPMSGTSVAVPFVSGTAAMLLGLHPGASAAWVKAAILHSVRRVPSLAGETATGGVLDAAAALRETDPPLAPASPPSGTIASVAGATYPGVGGFGGDGGPAHLGLLDGPTDVAAEPDGGYLIADTANNRVRRVWPDGTITTVAGGDFGHAGCGSDVPVDGVPAVQAALCQPRSVAPTPDGGFLVAELYPGRVRKVSRDGTITTVAGAGRSGTPATTTLQLQQATGVDVLPDGGFVVADADHDQVVRVFADGRWSVLATPTAIDRLGVSAVAVLPDGSVAFAEPWNDRVERVLADGRVVPLAGTGTGGFAGDGGPATAARLSEPEGLAVAADGGLLISDNGNARIRRVAPDGTITTIAGGDIRGFRGDGGPALAAELAETYGLAVTRDGNLLLADPSDDRIRMVGPYPGNGSFPPTAATAPAAPAPASTATPPAAPPVVPAPAVPHTPAIALRASSSVKVNRGHARVMVTVSGRASLRLDLSRLKGGRYRGVHHWTRTLAAGRHVLDLGTLKAGRYRAMLRLTSGTAHRTLTRTWRVRP